MKSATSLSRAGFVLAGGKSSRMGTNKAFLEFEGQTLLARALATLKTVSGNVLIVGDLDTFAEIGPAVEDLIPNCGPLGGIHTALSHSAAEFNLMLAVDMPFVSRELLELLLKTAEETGATVTVPRTSRGFQPLCAVYRPQFLYIAETSLRAGKYKIDAAFANIELRTIEERELAAAGFSERNFFNLNTPEDLSAADKVE